MARGSAPRGELRPADRPPVVTVTGNASPAQGLTVVCDLDGTLVDSAPDLSAALNTVLAEQGGPHRAVRGDPPSRGRRGARAHRTGPGAGRRPGAVRYRPACSTASLDVYRSRLTRESRPYPGVRGALRALARCGHPLAVCTNKPEDLARRMIAELGLDHFADAVVGGDTFAFRKPDRRTPGSGRGTGGRRPPNARCSSATAAPTSRRPGMPVCR